MRQIVAVIMFGVDDDVSNDLVGSILGDATVQIAEAVEHYDDGSEGAVDTYDVKVTWGIQP